jgi:hypothetical protein
MMTSLKQNRVAAGFARRIRNNPFRKAELLVGGLLLLCNIARAAEVRIGYRAFYDLSFAGIRLENALAVTNTSSEKSFCLVRKLPGFEHIDIKLVYDPVKGTYSENGKAVLHGERNVVQELFDEAFAINVDTMIVRKDVLIKINIKEDSGKVDTNTVRKDLQFKRKDGKIEARATDGGAIVGEFRTLEITTETVDEKIIPKDMDVYARWRIPWPWEWEIGTGKLRAELNRVEWVYGEEPGAH